MSIKSKAISVSIIGIIRGAEASAYTGGEVQHKRKGMGREDIREDWEWGDKDQRSDLDEQGAREGLLKRAH